MNSQVTSIVQHNKFVISGSRDQALDVNGRIAKNDQFRPRRLDPRFENHPAHAIRALHLGVVSKGRIHTGNK